MKDYLGNEAIPGKLCKRTTFSFGKEESFNPNKIEVYRIEEKQGKLVAVNGEGNSFPIRDRGHHGTKKIPLAKEP